MTSAASIDPFIDAIAEAPQSLLLTEKDVAALLQRSTRLLQKWRAQHVRPSYWIVVGEKLIRYPAHALADWIRASLATKSASDITADSATPDYSLPQLADGGLDEPNMTGGRRKMARQSSFASFLSVGRSQDPWLFVLTGSHRRPVDFVASLERYRSDEDDVAWLCLVDYV